MDLSAVMSILREFFFILLICDHLTATNGSDKKDDEKNIPLNTPFNFSHIIVQTALYCGPSFVCDKTLLSALGIPDDNGASFSVCGTCSCEEICLTNPEPCCPDVYFKHGYMECADLSVTSNNNNNNFYSVISTCPRDTDLNLTKKCTGDHPKLHLLKNPPVSSAVTRRTYKNQYCAACNNVSHWFPWTLMFDCRQPTDFNYLSSYEEILELVDIKQCGLHFSSSNPFYEICNDQKAETIASCNVSGTWRLYDRSIEDACLSSYNRKYNDIFKNVFCAMCNPPNLNLNRTINQCRDRNNRHNDNCAKLPTVEASFPYKNHYCHLCNQGHTFNPLEDVYLNYAVELYQEKNYYPFTTAIKFSFQGDILRKHIDELMQYSNSSKQRQNSAVMQYINATNLVRYSFALSGSGVCTPTLLPNYTRSLQKNCSCTIGCLYDCCDDFALQQPWKCVSERYFKTESISPTDYLALGGCLENHQGINQLCTDPKFTDFYQMFPVTAHSHYTETYANVFCFLCNKKNIDDQILNSLAYDLDVWELIIECKTYVNYKFFNSMQAYINFVEENNCLLKFKKRRNGLNCRDMYTSDRKGVGRCNVDGSQTSLDYDILFACERSEDYRFPRVISEGILYRNKFCLICNTRKVPSTDIIDTCSSNSTTSSSLIQKACHEFPSIHVCTNFRNVFCEMCNEVYRWCFFLYDDKQEPATGPPIIPTVGPTPLGFRSVFSLLDYDNVAVKSKTTSCSSNQIYDDFQDECMNITCFPGKTLMNGSCLSLLRNTENLRYTMAVRFKFIEITSNISLYNYMVNIRKLIKRDLSYSFTGTILVEDILLMSKGNCNYRANRLDDMYMYLKIFFPFSIERDKVENQLISLTNNSALWNNYFPDVWKVKVIPDQTSIFLPSLLWKLDREENCWLFPEKLQYGKSVFRNVLVAPLLTCNQLVMDNDAFGVPWKNIRFEYSQKGITLTFHQFQSFDNSGIRVCVDDLAYYVDTFRFRFKNEKNTSLMMLNIVCIGISLVCLLLTFVTYASFKSLRTIPGLNNMFLISSLFFAQLLLIVRPFLSIKDFNTSTVFLSSLTHFFWLATFFWLQICSFHMFRVFTSRFGIDKRTDCHKNTILKYILYGFGTSASIVLLNIVISVIISSGETTGYDKTSTLMTHRTAFIVTLICPLTYVCLTNIIFYISAVYKILSSPHIENSTGNRIHFSVYIKLFSITGLTWVLQIVDMFLTVSFLSYIVAILNGLQGLFIFISYVCNIRVCKMWISIFRTLSSTSSNSNSILHSVRSETTAL